VTTRPPPRALRYEEALAERARGHRERVLRPGRPLLGTPYLLREGRRLLNLGSNDYLGLAADPEVISGAEAALREWGGGGTSSRLLTGSFDLHETLEEELARWLGRERTLLFPSGYQANTTILPALVDRSGLILADRLVHHSLLQGALLSRARLLRFNHNDPGHLEGLLNRHASGVRGPILIMTESLFSMDGDRAPLSEIASLADRHEALLLVDDAHALGVWGEGGRGLGHPHPRIDLLLGTFGKAFGGGGAFVATSTLLRDTLIHLCGGVIYTTAPAPSLVGGALAALRRIQGGVPGHASYLERVRRVRERLEALGLGVGRADAQILPIALTGEEASLRLSQVLEERGILAPSIRPPTVPEGSSRLRLSLTLLHGEEEFELLLGALEESLP